MSFINTAYADSTSGATRQGGGMQLILILVVFAAIFYFMIYRPQAKKAKQHRELMSSLSKGEEVLTNGGLVGKIQKVSEGNEYIVIALNDTTEVTIKRDFITSVLPKGTIQSL